MGHKKRTHPDVDELLSRPWCYYCERDFEDLKLLISHQKAKHFKCDRCGRRLNTAGGLSVHMNQVHKESLSTVENALPNRQGLDVEIFGMEGVPEDILQQHNQRIVQNYYQAQADRFRQTGNPPPGQVTESAAKKARQEPVEDIKKRLQEFRASKALRQASGNAGAAPPREGQTPPQNASPGSFANPFNPPQAAFGGFNQAAPPNGAAYPASSLPARPQANAPVSGTGLPQRPPYGAPGSGAYAQAGGASTLDELVSGAARQGDDIDNLIRMAEAGIKPPQHEAAAPEKPAKKEKTMRMIYGEADFGLEERMAMIPRYADTAMT